MTYSTQSIASRESLSAVRRERCARCGDSVTAISSGGLRSSSEADGTYVVCHCLRLQAPARSHSKAIQSSAIASFFALSVLVLSIDLIDSFFRFGRHKKDKVEKKHSRCNCKPAKHAFPENTGNDHQQRCPCPRYSHPFSVVTSNGSFVCGASRH